MRHIYIVYRECGCADGAFVDSGSFEQMIQHLAEFDTKGYLERVEVTDENRAKIFGACPAHAEKAG